MDFREYLEKSAKEIDGEVEKILDQEIKKAQKIDKKLAPLLKTFKASCMGGKRIRGTLIKLGYELARTHLPGVSLDFARDKKAHLEGGILRIAAAYEIFHGAILAHDDIMDKSVNRRGQLSLYKKVGIAEAITLADYGFFLAFKIFSSSFFAQVAAETALGQLLDLKKANPKATARLKTARYTVSGPLQLGASLVGANQNLIRELEEFGEHLGIAYQLKDDILDGDSIDYQKAKKYIALAKKMIPRLAKAKKMSKLLEQMAEYMVARIK